MLANKPSNSKIKVNKNNEIYTDKNGCLKYGFLPSGERYLDDKGCPIKPYNEDGQRYIDENGELLPGFDDWGMFYLKKDGYPLPMYKPNGQPMSTKEYERWYRAHYTNYSNNCQIL